MLTLEVYWWEIDRKKMEHRQAAIQPIRMNPIQYYSQVLAAVLVSVSWFMYVVRLARPSLHLVHFNNLANTLLAPCTSVLVCA